MMLALLLAAALSVAAGAEPVTRTAVAADGTAVAVYEYAPHAARPVTPILMFHQAGGDARGELGPIALKLAGEGRRVFTADLRSGGGRFGGVNATAAGYKGPPPSYCDTYPDLVAALETASRAAGGPLVVAGSSYSAALVVKLAAEHPDKVAGFASFSPAGGSPMQGCEPEPYLSRLRVPGVAIRNRGAQPLPQWIAESNGQWAAVGYPVTVLKAEGHGASLLVADRTQGDVAGAWGAFTALLAKVDKAD